MCGIVGIIGKQEVAPLLIEGLRRLEYRGYDSAGVATLVDGAIERRRAEGKLIALATSIDRQPVQGNIGIGHTRWATHGVPACATRIRSRRATSPWSITASSRIFRR